MKKSLLTLAAAVGVTAFAHGQGTLAINGFGGSAGFNTASSSEASLTGWYTGTLTLTVFTINAASESTLASTINADEKSSSSVATGLGLITSDFTPQAITSGNSQWGVSDGGFTGIGNVTVGSSGSLPQTTPVYYALVFETAGDTLEGYVVLNGGTATSGTTPGSTPYDMNNGYPTSDQNILLVSPAPTPEPTTLALSGLGGLSMLFLRRRKA
jgi:hypothetical protein